MKKFFKILNIFFISLSFSEIFAYSGIQFCRDANKNKLMCWVESSEEKTVLKCAALLDDFWSTPTIISDPKKRVVSVPSIEMNQLGQAVVVWKSYDKQSNKFFLESASYFCGGTWEAPSILCDLKGDEQDWYYKCFFDDEGEMTVIFFSSSMPEKIHSISGSIARGWESLILTAENK